MAGVSTEREEGVEVSKRRKGSAPENTIPPPFKIGNQAARARWWKKKVKEKEKEYYMNRTKFQNNSYSDHYNIEKSVFSQ